MSDQLAFLGAVLLFCGALVQMGNDWSNAEVIRRRRLKESTAKNQYAIRRRHLVGDWRRRKRYLRVLKAQDAKQLELKRANRQSDRAAMGWALVAAGSAGSMIALSLPAGVSRPIALIILVLSLLLIVGTMAWQDRDVFEP